MSFAHGKDTVVLVNSIDISEYTNSTTFSPEVDEHDTTTYGKDAHDFQGGLKNGQATIGGIFDSAEAGTPAAVLLTGLGTRVPFVYRPAGTGAGKPERNVLVLIRAYEETAPVADMVSWTATLRMVESVDDGVQSA